MARVIMGISIQRRSEAAKDVQDALTECGCFIRTRLGLHQASDEHCGEDGLIVLEFIPGASEHALELKRKLSGIPSVSVKTMEF